MGGAQGGGQIIGNETADGQRLAAGSETEAVDYEKKNKLDRHQPNGDQRLKGYKSRFTHL